MKLMVCGYARHGKDQFCEFMGLTYISSSMAALDEAIWPEIGKNYETKEQCFEDRVNHRGLWHRLITEFNTPDLTRLGRAILKEHDVYCGIRNREEFHALRRASQFDLSVWIDASNRKPHEGLESCSIRREDCDIIITNNGTLEEFMVKAVQFARAVFGKKQSAKDMIVEWADSVFPNRTITDAIQKMMLEEIPEYLMAQDDPMELADIGILLYDIAHLAGVDLDSAILKKMEINKKRSWAIDSTTGMLNHTKKAAAEYSPFFGQAALSGGAILGNNAIGANAMAKVDNGCERCGGHGSGPDAAFPCDVCNDTEKL